MDPLLLLSLQAQGTMAKRVSKKGASMSLRDFYDSTPGAMPVEAQLPSKPGEIRCARLEQFTVSRSPGPGCCCAMLVFAANCAATAACRLLLPGV